MPLYLVRESIFADLHQVLKSANLELICVEPQHIQRDQVTMYRGWEVRRQDGVKVIMWGKYSINRDVNDLSVELTLGTPSGSSGLVVLAEVERCLVVSGGQKIA